MEYSDLQAPFIKGGLGRDFSKKEIVNPQIFSPEKPIKARASIPAVMRGDWHSAHRTGHIGEVEPHTYPGEDEKCHSEAESGGDCMNDGMDEGEIFLCDNDRYTEHGAVGGNQGQEDTEGGIQPRRTLLHNDFEHLDKHRYDEDEGCGLHISQPERHEHIVLQEPCHGSGYRHDKCHRHTHAEGGIYVFSTLL